MKYTPFDELRFRSSLSKAMKNVQSILDSTRQPRLAEDETHTYEDKYALVEFLTNTSIASQMNALERLGLDPSKIIQVMDWVHGTVSEANSKKHQQVTLRFSAEDSCVFLVEQEVEMNTGLTKEIEQTVTTNTSGGGAGGASMFGTANAKTETVRTKVITKVKEYHWKVTVTYKIVIFPGINVEEGIELQKRSTETVVVTAAGTGSAGSARSTRVMSPLPERTMHPPIDTKLTWFFQMLSPKEQTCQFSINREHLPSCKTPRRNDEVTSAEVFNRNMHDWSRHVRHFFLRRVEVDINGKHNPVKKETGGLPLVPGATAVMTGLIKEPAFNGKRVRIVDFDKETQRYKAEPVDPSSGIPGVLSIKPGNILPDSASTIASGPPLATINDDSILCPILPLMEKESILDMGDVGEFLNEQSRAIDEAIDSIAKEYPSRQLLKQISVAEATIVLICTHLESLTTQYLDSIDYIEYLLKQQLIQAIGKEITTKDFEPFMVSHNRKLFSILHRPSPFSYAIRRPGFYPDGILAIETSCVHTEQSSPDPIETFSRKITGSASQSVFIPINAATSVEIIGDRYLHGWMQHRFEFESTHSEYNIACRARQFSCFIVLIGAMRGPDTFDASNAIIVQNKDEVLIPLLTNVLPSAKEFRDAIVSLSPEQQAFAKAFRSIQLESSVFGICLIQIKPQLEALLCLPDCSLTKEIQLTQDLVSLFIDYQIPSDLLAFSAISLGSDETGSASCTEKIEAVRGYVKAVLDVINASKEKMLKEEEMRNDMRTEMLVRNNELKDLCGKQRGRLAWKSMVDSSSGRDDWASLNMESSLGSGEGEIYINKDGKKVRRVKKTQSTFLRMEGSPGRQTEPPSFESQNFNPLSPLESPPSDNDFTLLPQLLDTELEKHDKDGALRSTIVKTGPNWIRMRQTNLLVSPEQGTLTTQETENEKKKAFDLLDAISRSGTLPIRRSELHVVVSVSHCFDNDVIGSVIQDNINPIEKVERSSLILASIINGVAPSKLVKNQDDVNRLSNGFPTLMESS